MSPRVFLSITAITALCVSTLNGVAGWADDTSYIVGMGAMVIMMLVCFWIADFGRYGSKQR